MLGLTHCAPRLSAAKIIAHRHDARRVRQPSDAFSGPQPFLHGSRQLMQLCGPAVRSPPTQPLGLLPVLLRCQEIRHGSRLGLHYSAEVYIRTKRLGIQKIDLEKRMTHLRGAEMMESEYDLQRTPHLLSMRVPPDLYREIATEAAELGVSGNDAARYRLRMRSLARKGSCARPGRDAGVKLRCTITSSPTQCGSGLLRHSPDLRRHLT
jgi:hypothetical protein